MMKIIAITLVIVACSIASRISISDDDHIPAINKELILEINTNQRSSWIAGHNEFFNGKSVSQAKRLMGFVKDYTIDEFVNVVETVMPNIPENFTSTEQWPQCTTIGTIYNQADCGACWAFGCIEAVSDRWCIHKGKQYNNILSFMDLVTCGPGMGCEGGDPYSAFSYAASPGIVSSECEPYTIPTCPPAQQPCLNFVTTPSCENGTCNVTSVKWDPLKLSSFYYVGGNNASVVEAMQTEIMTNGPVEACFEVYSDFVNYKSGVYQYQNGTDLGGHCIKIIGWGVENKTPYWLCNNSWTTTWGDNGQFKILRGQNECGIESDVVAGLP